MIYNLVRYLITEFPTINFVAEAFNSQSPEDCIQVQDTGGQVNHDNGRQDVTVQFKSRSKDNWLARRDIELVFEKVKNRFGLELPEVTVNSIIYSAVMTYRIVPIQKFGYIGTSSENHHMYTFNSIVTLDYS